MTQKIQRLVQSNGFGNFIIAVILLAAVLVGLETYPDVLAKWGGSILFLNSVVILVFAIEAFLKMAQFGRKWYLYFADGWNIFDFSILVLVLLPFAGHTAAVLRLARILRALRLVSQLPRLQLLVMSLLRSIPSMLYVGILLGLLFYVYGVIGVFLFRENDPFHFGNLQTALLSLFSVVTLEGWTNIMYIQMYGTEYAATTGLSEGTPPISTAQPIIGAVYFVTFVLLGTMIMLNLFIGVIINSMHESQREVERDANSKELPPSAELFEIEERLMKIQRDISFIRERVRKK